MNILELILTATALSMDAFAVSVSSGIVAKRFRITDALLVGLFFGSFQALMPTIGWLAAYSIRGLIESVDHWIAFGLLAAIGSKMIYDVYKKGEETEKIGNPFAIKTLFIMAIATSIDALAVGISFAIIDVDIVTTAITIGIITFAISVWGVYLGNRLCLLCEKRATFIGGIILILIGIKILLDHTIF